MEASAYFSIDDTELEEGGSGREKRCIWPETQDYRITKSEVLGILLAVL
jgi:hypothetical protein